MQAATIQLEETLSSAALGFELAEAVLSHFRSYDRVVLDWSRVRRMTPSFCNAFVLRVLEQHPADEFRSRCVMIHADDRVTASLLDSARRYREGIRLSDAAHRVHAEPSPA